MTARPRGWDAVVPNPLGELYKDYREATLRTISWWIKDPELAEDLCSTVWLKITRIWERSNGLSLVNNIEAYLFLVAKRTCINHFRLQRRRKVKATFVALTQDCQPCEHRRISQDGVDDLDQIRALLPYLNPVEKFVLSGIAAQKSYEIIAREICDVGLRATCKKNRVGEIVNAIREKARRLSVL